MLIREAKKSDVPAIRLLQQQLFEEGSIYGFVAETEEEIEKAIGSDFLVAEIDNQIVGFISGKIRVSDGLAVVPKDENYLEIENLYVAPQFRKQGVGSQLVNAILIKAKQMDARYALLYSATKDIHTILRFYERHNFQSWYVQMYQKL